MEQQEWVNYFKILYGRNPSPQEFTAAKKANFPPFAQEESVSIVEQMQPQAHIEPQFQSQPQAQPIQPAQVVQSSEAKSKKFKINLELIVKIIVFIFIGLVGYVLGYHLS